MTSILAPDLEEDTLETGESTDVQVLTLRLGQSTFAIDVSDVQEILDHTTITPLANAPATLLGMIDVRGVGVPVIDLKRKLSLGAETEIGENTRIVVLNVSGAAGSQTLAVVADAVYEVLEIDMAELERPPQLGGDWDNRFMRGLGRRHGEFLTFLEIGALLAEQRLP